MSTVYFDYDSILQRLLGYFSKNENYANLLSYGVIRNELSAIAQEMAYEMQGVEYYSFENFWEKARNKSSLLVQSPMHGYNVPRKQGAKGTVRVSTNQNFNGTYSVDLTIPKFFSFSGGGLKVCTTGNSVLSANSTYLDVEVIQGEVIELTKNPSGIVFEKFLIDDDSVDNSMFEVYVNNELWTNVDTLYSYSGDDKVYSMKTLPNLSGVNVCFGDNYFGKKLSSSDVVLIKYVSTKGSDGNINIGVIKNVDDMLVSSGYSVKLYATNTTAISGGKDYPTIEEIRSISPKVYQTGDRATNDTDYETLIKKNESDISKIRVWGIYDELNDLGIDIWDFDKIVETFTSYDTLVHIAMLDSDNNDITDADNEQLRQRIISMLHKKSDVADLIKFEHINKIPLIFDIEGNVLNTTSLTLNEIENNIKTKLQNTYSIDNMNFGENIYQSDAIRLIDEIEGIDNHITKISTFEEGNLFDEQDGTYYKTVFKLPLYPIDLDSVEIYIKNPTNGINGSTDYLKIAKCDDVGNIIGFDGNIISVTDSYLSQNEGLVELNVYSTYLTDDYSNYILKVVYKSSNDNLILNSKADLLYYYDSNVKLSYNL